jgi:chromosome segregation ATPase
MKKGKKGLFSRSGKKERLEELLKQQDYMSVQLKKLEQQVVFCRRQIAETLVLMGDLDSLRTGTEDETGGLIPGIETKMDKLEKDMLELKTRNRRLVENQTIMKGLLQGVLKAVEEKEKSMQNLKEENKRLKEKESAPKGIAAENGEVSIDALLERIAGIDIYDDQP